MAISADQLAKWFDTATEGDEEKVQRMIGALAALDTAFDGDSVALGRAVKILGGVAVRVEKEVLLGAAQRKINELQGQKQAINQNAQAQLQQSLMQQDALILAEQTKAAQFSAEIDAINQGLPSLLIV